MDCITGEKISQLQALIRGAQKVVVAAHTHPDGDALGCTAAMALYLRDFCGKDAAVLLPDPAPDTLRFALHPAVPYLLGPEAQAFIAQASLIILLDCNAFSRTDSLQDALEASPAPKVLIDHHLNPQTDSFDLVFSTPEISSASELLYWILMAMGEGFPDMAIGTALLTGMTTDTNNFANSVFPSTFQMAAGLLELGVDRDALLQMIYNSYRENRIRLIGYMQSQQMHILPEGASYMILTKEIQQRFDLREGESDGLVNMPLAIGAVRLSLLLKEEDGHFRVSLRSKKGTSAQNCAQRFFHGGGHENAAGGKLYPGQDFASEEELVPYLENALKSTLS
ncbi:MAG: bifunctional oligoribonuclease/PAP phosphatase NrnA [Bacteroidales bacterium]|nr:bifunctional oligoribonuclease/PAP phosphatase NrnA [Bacteroidales bacterium]